MIADNCYHSFRMLSPFSKSQVLEELKAVTLQDLPVTVFVVFSFLVHYVVR